MTVLASLPAAEALVQKLYDGAMQRLPSDRKFGRMRLLNSAESVYELLSRPGDFGKDYNLLTELGASRFDANGDEWIARRDLTQQMYKEAALSSNHVTWASHYARKIELLPEGPAEKLEAALLSSAAEILSKAFGSTVAGEPFAEWILNSRYAAIMAQRAAMYGATHAQLHELKALTAIMRRQFYDLVNEHPALVTALDTMAPRMRDCPASKGMKFDAVAEFMLAYLAGTETSISVMGWAILALSLHSDAQEDIAADVAKNGAKSFLLEVFVQEAMRMRPPIPLLSRRPQMEGLTLAGEDVPFETLFAIDIVGLHHSFESWDKPFQFMPDRREFRERSWNKRAFLPFSAGPRVCGGVGLARAEIHAALAELILRFRLSYKDTPMPLEFALTMRPKYLEKIQLERRNGTMA